MPGTRSRNVVSAVTSDSMKMPTARQRRAGADDELRSEPAVERAGDEGGEAKTPIIGRRPAPAPTAEKPSSFAMNCGRKTSAEKKIADIISVARQAAANWRLLEHVGRHQRASRRPAAR